MPNPSSANPTPAETGSIATISSGVPALDGVVQGLRSGDNVLWQVTSMDDYRTMASAFLRQSDVDGCVSAVIEFSEHGLITNPPARTHTFRCDPHAGFDLFTRRIDRIVNRLGTHVHYVFDNLTVLLDAWATDDLLADFFRVTCPHLAALDSVSYFMLQRGRHSGRTLARMIDTAQIWLDMSRDGDRLFVHPLKVWDRYTPTMHLPHAALSMTQWHACTLQAADPVAATLSTTAASDPAPRLPTPWESLYIKLAEYSHGNSVPGSRSTDIPALKQEMIRRVLGVDPHFIDLAGRHLTLADLSYVRDRLIGSGRIGGKAAGMLLARRILLGTHGNSRFETILDEPDAFFLGSDVFFTFLVDNDLFRTRLEATEQITVSWDAFPQIEHRFQAGRFPDNIMRRFRELLQHFGESPLIVRSSSLLEDSFGNAFAGKYESVFCVNQGTEAERMESLLSAVKRVYASVLSPDALAYRQRRGLLESEEQMAILFQRVSGRTYRHMIFPPLAGVAFSRNLYAWNDRIDPRQGVIRLVFGLGTRAVNRVGGDYPRIIAVSHPELRPEVGKAIAHYSQHDVDVLDLRGNTLTTMPAAELLADRDYPGMHLMISIMRDGHLFEPFSRLVPESADTYVITFANLLRRTDFTSLIGEMLERLEKAYGHPVDTEFTAFIESDQSLRLNLLQCRPMWLPGATPDICMPEAVVPQRVLFRAHRLLCGGIADNLRYIVYIDPVRYAHCPSTDMQAALGRVIGRLNALPDLVRDRYLLIGPGRWGTVNRQLGIHVNYADITNAAVLVELAREEAGHVPEVSYGTHFFLDLVEARIVYLPVYPCHPDSEFNQVFFDTSRNRLPDLLPDDAAFADLVRVIDVSQDLPGLAAHVIADSQRQIALCFLEKPGTRSWTHPLPDRAFGEKSLGFGF